MRRALLTLLLAGSALAWEDFFNGIVGGALGSVGFSPEIVNDAQKTEQELQCRLYGVGCKGDVIIDHTRIETRLELDCVDATPSDFLQDYGNCYDKMFREGNPYLFLRSRVLNSPYVPQTPLGNGHRWVSAISWSGPLAAYQTYSGKGGTLYDVAWGYWKSRDFPVWDCDSGKPGCRRASVCTMKGSVYGTVKNSQTPTPILLVNTEWSTLKLSDGADAAFGSWTVPKCLTCLTAPCDVSCAQGRVVGYPVPSEPSFHNQVMEKWLCERSCVSGTFLTCKQGADCTYRPATSYELASGDPGLRQWWAHNERSGANLPLWKDVPPAVQDCYPCLHADGRTHYGAISKTDKGLRQKGFLEFFCPGGALPPQDCPLDQVSRVDPATNRSGPCGCRPGYWWSAERGRCLACPPGHFCAWDGATPPEPRECPNDTYSTGGAEACARCSLTRQCDPGQALRRCLQSGGSGASGRFQQEDSACVPCFQCSQLGAGPEQVPCYQVTSLRF